MRIHDSLLGVLLTIFGAWVLVSSLGFPKLPGQPIGPGSFPAVLGVVFIAGGIMLFASGLRQGWSQVVMFAPEWRRPTRVASAFLVVFGTIGVAWSFEWLGFPVAAALLLLPLYLMSGLHGFVWPLVALIFLGVLHIVMTRLLLVPLPDGLLGAFL